MDSSDTLKHQNVGMQERKWTGFADSFKKNKWIETTRKRAAKVFYLPDAVIIQI